VLADQQRAQAAMVSLAADQKEMASRVEEHEEARAQEVSRIDQEMIRQKNEHLRAEKEIIRTLGALSQLNAEMARVKAEKGRERKHGEIQNQKSSQKSAGELDGLVSNIDELRKEIKLGEIRRGHDSNWQMRLHSGENDR